MEFNQKQIAEAFGKMGISYRTVFPDSVDLIKAYENHRWLVNIRGVELSVVAIPIEKESEDTFWEKWIFEEDEKIYHQVFFSKVPSMPYHDIYDGPREDDQFYSQLLNYKTWYVVYMNEMICWGYKKILEEY
jgi:hypothetical protein